MPLLYHIPRPLRRPGPATLRAVWSVVHGVSVCHDHGVRAAVAETLPGKPTIWEGIDIDEPGLGEVLLRVVACGVCHSDVLALEGTVKVSPLPFVLGHEPAGIVEAVGVGVKHLKPGDHVVACMSGFCGHCAQCVTGRPDRCRSRNEGARPAGSAPRLQRGDQTVHQYIELGGFAEWMLVAQHNLVKIDATLPLSRACLLGCGVLTGVGAVVNTARVPAGATVAVIGCGGVGNAVIQGARLAYAHRIVAVDVDDAKLDLALRCGATDVVNAAKTDPVAAVKDLLSGGADYVFEAIGRAPTVQQGIEMTATPGTMTVVGILDPNAQITMTGWDLTLRKTLQQCIMGSNRFVYDIPMLVEHVLAGRLDLDTMVSAEHPLDELPGAIEDLDHGNILGRTVITF